MQPSGDGTCHTVRRVKYLFILYIYKIRGHPDLNRGPLDLQSNALPLSYTPTCNFSEAIPDSLCQRQQALFTPFSISGLVICHSLGFHLYANLLWLVGVYMCVCARACVCIKLTAACLWVFDKMPCILTCPCWRSVMSTQSSPVRLSSWLKLCQE